MEDTCNLPERYADRSVQAWGLLKRCGEKEKEKAVSISANAICLISSDRSVSSMGRRMACCGASEWCTHIHTPAADHAADTDHLLKGIPDAIGRNQDAPSRLRYTHLPAAQGINL